MKYQRMNIYKNTSKGDMIAPTSEAKKAIRQGYLMVIGQGKSAYWIIQR